MDLEKLVEVNEDLIEKFNLSEYIRRENFPIIGAISALEITNEVEKCFIRKLNIPKQIDEILLDLYGIMQALFVSIDALYELSYVLTNSKKYININQNDVLRELKHIRNDVVGHPANRNIRMSGEAYCILKKDSFKDNNSFEYLICSKDKIIPKKVYLLDLINAYYLEANNILETLLDISCKSFSNEYFINEIKKLIDDYPSNNYFSRLTELKYAYLNEHPKANRNSHRSLWRIELIEKTYSFMVDDNLLDLKEYIIYLELIAIYTLLSGHNNIRPKLKKPKEILSFERFLRKNPDLIARKDILVDASHPLFSSYIESCLKRSKQNVNVNNYLNFLLELANKGENDLVYVYALPIKKFTKNNRK